MLETMIYNFNLTRIAYIIKKRLALVIAIACLGGILGGSYAFLTSSPVYVADVSFYVYSDPDYVNDSSVNVSNNDFTTAKNLLNSYMLVLKSKTVLSTIIDDLGLTCSTDELAAMISSRSISDTAVFIVSVSNSDPYTAMEIANDIAEVAPAAITRIVKAGGIEVIDGAELPTSPSQTVNSVKYIVLGAGGLGGIAFGIFLFLGLLDSTIRRKYEITNSFTIPVIGEIPEGKGKVLSPETSFTTRESYNLLRTNLLFTNQSEQSPVIAFTSSARNEGKTLSCVNTAVSFAELNKKVLIIDADMRFPSVGLLLNPDNKGGSGLSDFLGGMEHEPVIRESNKLGLSFLLAGTIPPNPAELLAGSKFADMIKRFREEYDYIFIDLPPVGVVSDASMVINIVDSFVMVVRAGSSRLDILRVSVELLGNIGARVCGFIFNAIPYESEDYRYRFMESYTQDAYSVSIGRKHKKVK